MQIDSIASGFMPQTLTQGVQSGEGLALPLPSTGGTDATQDSPSFGKMLSNAISEVNQAQNHAGDLATRFAAGEPLDVHQVMVASQEATISLNMAVQVRNKLTDAYQEIMRITV